MASLRVLAGATLAAVLITGLAHSAALAESAPQAAGYLSAEESRRVIVGSLASFVIFVAIGLFAWWRGPLKDHDA